MGNTYDDDSGRFINPMKLELRDRFAMAALTSLMAHPDSVMALREVSKDTRKPAAKLTAELAYEIADAMMEARK